VVVGPLPSCCSATAAGSSRGLARTASNLFAVPSMVLVTIFI
jgi:hypothetical protein